MVSLSGCGDTGGGVTAVPGSLQYEDGSPVPAASVDFHGEGAAAFTAQARDGKFTVPVGGENGIKPGSYKVTVRGPMLTGEEHMAQPPQSKTAGSGPPKMTFAEPDQVAKEYTDLSKTPLTSIQVAADKSNTIAIKVKKP